MLPAGWEGAPRVCQPTLNYAPLVHAIGGLTPDDEPMSLSRLVARPPLAAPASLATTVLDNGAYTDVLSGSSVAAASVAGIASLVWSLDPTLKPEQLMAPLYDNTAARSGGRRAPQPGLGHGRAGTGLRHGAVDAGAPDPELRLRAAARAGRIVHAVGESAADHAALPAVLRVRGRLRSAAARRHPGEALGQPRMGVRSLPSTMVAVASIS